MLPTFINELYVFVNSVLDRYHSEYACILNTEVRCYHGTYWEMLCMYSIMGMT